MVVSLHVGWGEQGSCEPTAVVAHCMQHYDQDILDVLFVIMT